MLPESKEGYSSYLCDLKSDSGQVTNGMTLSSESGDKYFIIIIKETKASIFRNESGDSFVVFLELDSNTLSDSRVRLFGFNSNLLYDDSSCM